MILNAWCSANSEQSSAPRTPVRIVSFQLLPELNGGNPAVGGGKVVGQLQLQNLPESLAAEFANGTQVTIEIKPVAP
jgi:hypothetical protein